MADIFAEKDSSAEVKEKTGKKGKKSKKAKKKKERKPHRLRRTIITISSILVLLAGMYTFLVYTNIPAIKSLRDAYIETAMSTMTHHWLAEWFFPQSVIDDVMERVRAEEAKQAGIESKWKDQLKKKTAEDNFYSVYDELDKASFEDYLKKHPECKPGDWQTVHINEAGFDDKGTSIMTKQGDQVLAVDANNRLMLVRIDGTGYYGVLAILKDPSLLRCCPAQYLGSIGEVLESIVPRNNGVLGINASGFADRGGGGNGGGLKGYAMCSGQEFGKHYMDNRKRLELRTDDKMYIVDSFTKTNAGTRDAVEFRPALIIDGVSLVNELSDFSSIQPRCCVGQSKDGDILMLVIEGRLIGRSLGIGLPECTKIMQRYNAYQAMNMDGGTSAVMWYDGEYITKCANPQIMCRYLPDAWVYGRK